MSKTEQGQIQVTDDKDDKDPFHKKQQKAKPGDKDKEKKK